MDAVVFSAPRAVEVRRVPLPCIEAPTDAIVRVDVAAICGSDLHPYNCREPCDTGTVFGHEFVGRIVELGDLAARVDPETASDPDAISLAPLHNLHVGQRVFAPFTTACGACEPCVAGLSARCTSAQLFGWRLDGRGLHGGQAQFVRVPLARSTLVPLPPAISHEDALLLGDILATAVFCAVNAGVLEGGFWRGGRSAASQLEAFFEAFDAAARRDAMAPHVAPSVASPAHGPPCYVVVGCGPVGLLATAVTVLLLRLRRELEAVAGLSPAPRVLAVDSVPSRLAAARTCGAETVLLPPPSASATDTGAAAAAAVCGAVASPAAPPATPPPRVVAALECVGSPAALRLAFDVLAPGATLSSVGVHTAPAYPFSPGEAYDRNVTLRCGRCPARSLIPWAARVVQLMRAAGTDPGALVISHRLPLTEAPRAYASFDAREDGWGKVILRPWPGEWGTSSESD